DDLVVAGASSILHHTIDDRRGAIRTEGRGGGGDVRRIGRTGRAQADMIAVEPRWSGTAGSPSSGAHWVGSQLPFSSASSASKCPCTSGLGPNSSSAVPASVCYRPAHATSSSG